MEDYLKLLVNKNNCSNLEGLYSCVSDKFDDITYDGRRRIYLEDLTSRDYALENTFPYILFFDKHVVDDHSWGGLLASFVSICLDIYPDMFNDSIFDFRTDWSKQCIFSKEQKTNFKYIKDELFLNVNHTSLHSCRLLQDLMDYFGFNKSSAVFFIHRAPSAERKEVLDYVEDIFKKYFENYIVFHHKKTRDYVQNNVFICIDKYLNPILKSISKTYYSFYLFDDLTVLTSYTNQVRNKIKSNYKFNDNAKKILNKYLDYILAFYKHMKPYYY